MWTPYEIDIVLHHHTTHAEYQHRDAPMYSKTIDRLVGLDVLHRDENGLLTTSSRGKALVEMWCEQPLPVEKFVDPRFEKPRTA